MLVWPSPFQSPTTGRKPRPGAPKANGVTLGAPALVVVRRYQVALPGSKAPMASWCSAVKLTVLSVLAGARLALPAGSPAAPAAKVAVTVPLRRRPVTETV